MNIDNLLAFISTLAALSLATERIVEIIKGYIPALGQKEVILKKEEATEEDLKGLKERKEKESKRKANIQILTVICGIITASLAQKAIGGVAGLEKFSGIPGIILLGFLTSGGSSLWNSILEYVIEVKNIKKKIITP